MAAIAEAIFLHSLSMWEFHSRYSSINIFQVISQRKLVQSEHYQRRVRVYPREYLNSVFVGLKVRLLDKSHLFSFSRLGDKTRLN